MRAGTGRPSASPRSLRALAESASSGSERYQTSSAGGLFLISLWKRTRPATQAASRVPNLFPFKSNANRYTQHVPRSIYNH
eukprot:3508243-Pleurochrysis_carterae.AAC.4